jgi:hypothetical protein
MRWPKRDGDENEGQRLNCGESERRREKKLALPNLFETDLQKRVFLTTFLNRRKRREPRSTASPSLLSLFSPVQKGFGCGPNGCAAPSALKNQHSGRPREKLRPLGLEPKTYGLKVVSSMSRSGL